MKKMTFLLLSLFCVLGLTSAASYENLYIVGNGCDAGWDTGKAIQMTNEGEGIFTWTGTLKGKDTGDNGNVRFKFLVARAWSPSLTCRFDVAGHLLLTSGEETDIFEFTGGAYDNAFQVPETAEYTLHVDLNTMKITCTKAGDVEPVLNLNELFLIGNGTNAEGNWDKDNPIEMMKVVEGIFIWSGNLYTENGSEFKFLNVKGIWSNSVNPLDGDLEVAINTDYNLNFRPLESSPNDFKFKITTAGVYTIKVNLHTMKICIIPGNVVNNPDLNHLYLAGGGTNAEGNWDKENPIEMTKISEGVFRWSGNLYTAINNEFKFQNVKGIWSNSINPVDGNIDFAVNTDYNLHYRPLESSPNDNKFKVTTAGVYTIDVDLTTMKVRITAGGTGIADINVLPFKVVTENGTVQVITADNSLIQSVNLFDITGKSLYGKNLSKGIYVLKVKYSDKEYVQKVMVK